MAEAIVHRNTNTSVGGYIDVGAFPDRCRAELKKDHHTFSAEGDTPERAAYALWRLLRDFGLLSKLTGVARVTITGSTADPCSRAEALLTPAPVTFKKQRLPSPID